MRFPHDAEYAECHKILSKVKARGATKLSLQATKKGEGASAEIIAEPRTPTKTVAAVVKELLDCGMTKLSVEVKK